jgi:hypothetical protein
VGVAGELHVGGTQVARGYLRRDDLTRERFIADPNGCAPAPACTAPRPRALARRRHPRIPRPQRLPGQACAASDIELGEIESRLLECAGVREAAVLVREDTPGAQRLVAYVVRRRRLRCRGAARRAEPPLAEYMVPAAFVRLDAFPRSPNGKLERRALPAPMRRALPPAPTRHRRRAEEAVAALWQELLGLERVGRRDHFFELGGHSLMAIQVAARLRAALGVALPLAEVFAQPRLSDLALAATKGTPRRTADRAGRPRCRAAAVLVAATPVVPRPARCRGRRRLPHARRAAPVGPARRGRAARRVRAHRGAPRGAAHALSRRRTASRCRSSTPPPCPRSSCTTWPPSKATRPGPWRASCRSTPTRPSTSRTARCCASRCCGCPTTSTCSCWHNTTSSPTPGR